MAGTSAEDQDMQDFVRGLFQDSPDLSVLTHAIVRKKYLAHVGQETLTKEEKEKLKRLVEEELVQMQVDDPPSNREVLTKLETLVRSGGQKRHLCTSDTSGDEVKSSREQKKQRTKKELKVSSDEQDSGIDSKKMPVYSRPRSAGKFSSTLDEGDSGAEDHSDGSGSNRQSTKKKREAGGSKASQEHQSGRQRGRSGSESEDSKKGQERRAKIKSQGESESWEESEDDSEEEDRRRTKVTSRKQGRKSVKLRESESDSDNTGDSQKRKEAPQTKTRGADEGKQGYRLESSSEDEEEPERWIGKGGMTKTKRKNVSRKELMGEQGNSERSRSTKQEGKQKPKRTMSSSDESEMGNDGSKALLHKRGGSRTSSSEGGESQSEAETGGSKCLQPPGSSSKSESGSENSEVEYRGKKRKIKKRSRGASGSEDEKSKGKAMAKPQKESVSEMESEEELEDSGSESEEKRKYGQQKKGTPKHRIRRSSKGTSENELDEEKGGSSLEENARYSKQQHQGKDREHSGKSEDHPSIQRLKRYIRECGVHRNYKKLLAGCRSRRAQVEALKKELENIGLKGTPSLVKCRALKQKREEAAEVASLDLSNIITTEGRPRRRNVWSLYSKPQESPSSPEESPIRRPATDWSHLRGVISSDGESS